MTRARSRAPSRAAPAGDAGASDAPLVESQPVADDQPVRETKPSEHDREIELKYAVDDSRAVRKLIAGRSIAGLRAGPWRTLELVDRYIDTPSGSLERSGYGARLRHLDHRTLLTVKSTRNLAASKADGSGKGSRRALHARVELEGRANRRLDPVGWPESAARSVVEATAGGEPLRTLFTIEQRREVRDLFSSDTGAIVATVYLDEAAVSRFGRQVGSFVTLEIEAADPDARGAGAALETVAAELEASGLVRPEPRSKEAIGRGMVEGPRRVRAKPPRRPGVEADDTVGEAGRKILRQHLLRMLEAEPGARAGDDIEAVHKMRVATRRMRAAWRVFDGAYRRRPQRRYVGELREVAQTLGAVRDMDVQLDRLTAYMERAGAATDAQTTLAPLVEEWRRRRGEARAHLLDLLAGPDYDRFVDDYREFVETPGAGAADDNPGRVRDAAAGRIWLAYERLRAHDAILPFADVPALHAIRIDGKRFRYTLEFFREALPATADTVIADVTKLQDHLGLLNDAQVAADLTRGWLMASASTLSAETRKSAGGYLTANEREIARLRRGFNRVWRHVAGRSFRRRLALVVSAV